MNHKKKQKPRRSIRLQSYDYSSPGEYFVTICIQDRRCLFGDVVDGEMRLNRLGRIAQNEWINTESHACHIWNCIKCGGSGGVSRYARTGYSTK